METAAIKETLTKELEEVTTGLSEVAVLNHETGDWEAKADSLADNADPNDAADVAEESIEHQAVTADLETRYRNLNRALEKIESGSFGVCELCQKEIEAARIEANPAARTCVEDRDRESELSL